MAREEVGFIFIRGAVSRKNSLRTPPVTTGFLRSDVTNPLRPQLVERATTSLLCPGGCVCTVSLHSRRRQSNHQVSGTESFRDYADKTG